MNNAIRIKYSIKASQNDPTQVITPVKPQGYARSIIRAMIKVEASNQKPIIYQSFHADPAGMACNPFIKI